MNDKYHILIAEDEEEMAHLIASYLRRERYEVSIVANGIELLQALEQKMIDAIVLDVMMPYVDGLSACKTIRDFSTIPIIMVTAKGEEADRVAGLKLGADDYIVKPFSPRELVARVEAVLRRANPVQAPSIIVVDDLYIDLDGRTVKYNHHLIQLTRKEYDLLHLLAKNQDRVFSREQLHEHVWGMDHSKGSLRTVDTHIKTLRLKLGQGSEHIKTVWGIGYKLEGMNDEKH